MFYQYVRLFYIFYGGKSTKSILQFQMHVKVMFETLNQISWTYTIPKFYDVVILYVCSPLAWRNRTQNLLIPASKPEELAELYTFYYYLTI